MKLKLMRWTGGKYRMTQIINPLMPECSEYYEPFLGSGAVLLNKCRTEKEIVNDLDEDLYKLHTVLADHDKMTELLNKLDKHPVNEETFIQAKECLDKKPEERVGMDEIEVSRCKYTIVELSYNALGKNYSDCSKDRFIRDAHYYFPKICARYQGVDFHNEDGIELIARVKDNPDAFVFADPPYDHKTRGNTKIYKCEMWDAAQKKMLETLKNAKCKIMLCGYADENGDGMYDQALLPLGWKRYELTRIVQSCQNKEKKDIAVEYIWVNYELPEVASSYINMSTKKVA